MDNMATLCRVIFDRGKKIARYNCRWNAVCDESRTYGVDRSKSERIVRDSKVEVKVTDFALLGSIGGYIEGTISREGVEDLSGYTVKVLGITNNELGSAKADRDGRFSFNLGDDLFSRIAKEVIIQVFDGNSQMVYNNSYKF
jgi:hypothetical protein